MNNPQSAWYNYKTKEFEYHSNAPEDLRDYIPQHPSALGMYDCLIEMDETPLDAAKRVLLVCVGERAKDE